MAEYLKPLPALDNEQTQPYWDHLKQHNFSLQKCQACGHIRFPVLSVCPDCLSDQAEWVPLSGRGKVWSWVKFFQLYHPGWENETPYNVVYVLLDEGIGIMSNLVNVDPDDIYMEMPVQVYYDDVTSEVTLPKFEPIQS